jgi:hypothetical protein
MNPRAYGKQRRISRENTLLIFPLLRTSNSLNIRPPYHHSTALDQRWENRHLAPSTLLHLCPMKLPVHSLLKEQQPQHCCAPQYIPQILGAFWF